MTREEMQQDTAEMFLKLKVKRALIIIGTGGGKTRIPMLIIKKLKPKKILFLSENTLGRDTTIPAEMKKWGLESYMDKTEFVTYHLAYKWKKKTKSLKGYFVIADEADFAMTKEYGKFFKEYSNIPTFAMTGFCTENKRTEFEKYFSLIVDISTEELQEQGIVNQSKYIFIQFALNKIRDIPVTYNKDGEAKKFMQSENGTYLYFRKQEKKYYAKQRVAERMNDIETMTKCEFQLGPRGIAKYRAEFLYNLDSAARIVNKLKKELKEKDPNGKIITFSVRTKQADKLSEYTYHGKNKKAVNDKRYEDFENGVIRELATCDKVNRNANLVNVNHAIIESFQNNLTTFKQMKGRMLRLDVGNCSNIYVLLPYYINEITKKDENGNKNTKYEIAPTKAVKWLRDIMKPWFNPDTMPFETWNYTGMKIKKK